MTYEAALASLLSSIFGGLIVAISNHIMTRRREQEKRLSDLRIEHLISCWKKIERAASVNHDAIGMEDKRKRYDDLEDAIASIMLLGDRSEVDAASQFARELATRSNAPVNILLNTLRQVSDRS